MNLSIKPPVNAKLELFLNQVAIETGREVIKRRIMAHLTGDPDRYVLFRNSSLYFFEQNAVKFIEEIQAQSSNDFWRFDGYKVTQLDPEYYLGTIRSTYTTPKTSKTKSWELEIGFGSTIPSPKGESNLAV